MQLDLFNDNRPGILLRIADEFILALDFDQAVSTCEQLINDYPGDRCAPALLVLTREWRDLLAGNRNDPTHLNTLWLRLESIQHPPLRTAVLGVLLDSLRTMPEPESIYMAPRFHLGHLFMEAGRHAEAAECFQTAILRGARPRGRFFVWRGNALTRSGRSDDAIGSYLSAFLEDPGSVDINSVGNQVIQNLSYSFCHEDEDIDEDDEIAWLPVWGWLHGVFALHLNRAAGDSTDAARFAALIDEGNTAVPRLWFDMLAYAETLRTITRNDRELAAIRRLMKRQNRFMFEQYMDKIRGRNLVLE